MLDAAGLALIACYVWLARNPPRHKRNTAPKIATVTGRKW